ncbi:MAG: fibronectin type III domain-containing protein [Chloroflexota bacterium]|nr:fibronectin type III domain-containing protein [Chloroflexota bacterium]
MRYRRDIAHTSRRSPGARIPTRKPVARDSITVSWKLPTGSGAVASYKLERSADNDSTTWPQPNDDNFPNYAGHVIEGITETMQEVTGLTCGVTYSFRVSAKGGGSTTYADVHGPTSDPPAAGSTLPCLTPPPAPSNVTAVRNDNGIAVSWDTETGVASYKLEGSNDNGSTWTFYTKDNITPVSPRTLHQVTGLTCGPTYAFRVSALGDGTKYKAVYGITELAGFTEPGVAGQSASSAATARSTSGAFCLAPLPTPEVDVIPLTRGSVHLMWEHILGAKEYYVRFRKKGENSWPSVGIDGHYIVKRFEHTDHASLFIDLRRIVGGEGLADSSAYEFQVQTRHESDETLHSTFSNVITIVDSPILSANGDAGNIVGRLLGKIVVKWKGAGEPSDNVQYTLRWRKLFGEHTDLGWTPSGWVPDLQDTEYRRKSKETSDREYTLGGITINLDNRIETGKVYALQLNYTINGREYYSARDWYAWSSHEAAGDGERVATFPLNYPVSDKTYEYRICEEGFPSEYLDDWKKLIRHALEQWEVATGLVTMTYVGAICADYSRAISEVSRDFGILSGRMLTQSELNQLRGYLRTLDVLTNAQTDDEEFNEIIMVNDIDGPYAQFRQAGVFPEFSSEFGISGCVFLERPAACAAPRHVHPVKGNITDILLQKRGFGIDPVVVPGGDEIVDESDTRFNTCPGWTISDDRYRAYWVMLHEAGHVLGIRGGEWEREEWAAWTASHPTVSDSVMSYKERNLKAYDSTLILPREPNCSPYPLDILAIYALYQSR